MRLVDAERVNREERILLRPESHIQLATNLPVASDSEIDVRTRAGKGVAAVFPFSSVSDEVLSLPSALDRAYAGKAELLLYFSKLHLDAEESWKGFEISLLGQFPPGQAPIRYEVRLYDVLARQQVDAAAIVISRAFMKTGENADQIDEAFRRYAALVTGKR